MPVEVIDLEVDGMVDLISEGDLDDPTCGHPESKDEMIIGFCNVSNALKYKQRLIGRRVGVTFMCEHSIMPAKMSEWYQLCKEDKRKRLLYTVDETARKAYLGGVGVITNARTVIKLETQTEAARKAINTGRLGLFAVEISSSVAINVAVIYGKSGGAQCKKKAAITDKLVKTAEKELAKHPEGPKIIMGDLNANTSDLGYLKMMLAQEEWLDIGQEAGRWGGNSCEHTCIGANAKRTTRRDYMIANAEAAKLIKGFRVLHHEVSLYIAYYNSGSEQDRRQSPHTARGNRSRYISCSRITARNS